MAEVDDELRGILTKRDAEVLGRALPRIHAYFDQNDQMHVPSSRARRAGGETESVSTLDDEDEHEEEMKSSRARRAGGETESTQEEVASGR